MGRIDESMSKYLVIIFLMLSGNLAFSGSIVVAPDSTQNPLKVAIEKARRFDTIHIKKGLYKTQNIVINKPLTIIGIQHPVLDGENKYEILTVRSDSVNIQGLTIKNSASSSIEEYSGIKVYNANHVQILDNILEDTFFGIYLYYSHNVLIKGNQITAHQVQEQQSGNGIHCWRSDSLQIIQNTIRGHRDGIYFEFVTQSLIWRNISTNNIRYGLHFMFSHDDAYIGNIFRNNGAGVSVMYTKGVKMFNNFFEKNWGDMAHGLLLKDISDSHISGNYFDQNTNAIYMEGASRIELTKNTFRNNGWAFKIQANCMDVNVLYNNFIGNSFDVGTNGSLVLNHFSENYWDKYEGYDLNRDQIGDVPYRPVSLYSMIVEINPPAMVLFRSLIISLMDKSEKILPSITPENLVDNKPLMKQLFL